MVKLKIFLISFFILIICFSLAGCSLLDLNINNNDRNELDSNEKYIKIDISENGSTLNHEMYTILDESIIKLKTVIKEDAKKYVKKAMTGYSLNNSYYFEGIKEGNTEIWVLDICEEEIWTVKKYVITVDRNLKTKIVNTSEAQTVNRKCAIIKKDIESSSVFIADNNIVHALNNGMMPNQIFIIGIKEGNTIVSVKGKNNKEIKYNVKVDNNLNVEIKEI